MGPKHNSSGNRTRSTLSIFVVISLCCFFYLLGAWQKSGFGKGDKIAFQVTKQKDCNVFAELNSDLNFETHHNVVEIVEPSEPKAKDFKPCDVKYADYTPCQEQDGAMKFPREKYDIQGKTLSTRRGKIALSYSSTGRVCDSIPLA